MATLKWYEKAGQWKRFHSGALGNIILDLKNIVVSINNMASAIRNRCRRDKNLGDIYDSANARTNLELVGDCSLLKEASHHHDSRYLAMIEDLRKRLEEMSSFVDKNMSITIVQEATADNTGGKAAINPGNCQIGVRKFITDSAGSNPTCSFEAYTVECFTAPSSDFTVRMIINGGFIANYATAEEHASTFNTVAIASKTIYSDVGRAVPTVDRYGYEGSPDGAPPGYVLNDIHITGVTPGQTVRLVTNATCVLTLKNFDKNGYPLSSWDEVRSKIQPLLLKGNILSLEQIHSYFCFV